MPDSGPNQWGPQIQPGFNPNTGAEEGDDSGPSSRTMDDAREITYDEFGKVINDENVDKVADQMASPMANPMANPMMNPMANPMANPMDNPTFSTSTEVIKTSETIPQTESSTTTTTEVPTTTTEKSAETTTKICRKRVRATIRFCSKFVKNVDKKGRHCEEKSTKKIIKCVKWEEVPAL